jgi:hypothetical protein
MLESNGGAFCAQLVGPAAPGGGVVPFRGLSTASCHTPDPCRPPCLSSRPLHRNPFHLPPSRPLPQPPAVSLKQNPITSHPPTPPPAGRNLLCNSTALGLAVGLGVGIPGMILLLTSMLLTGYLYGGGMGCFGRYKGGKGDKRGAATPAGAGSTGEHPEVGRPRQAAARRRRQRGGAYVVLPFKTLALANNSSSPQPSPPYPSQATPPTRARARASPPARSEQVDQSDSGADSGGGGGRGQTHSGLGHHVHHRRLSAELFTEVLRAAG